MMSAHAHVHVMVHVIIRMIWFQILLSAFRFIALGTMMVTSLVAMSSYPNPLLAIDRSSPPYISVSHVIRRCMTIFVIKYMEAEGGRGGGRRRQGGEIGVGSINTQYEEEDEEGKELDELGEVGIPSSSINIQYQKKTICPSKHEHTCFHNHTMMMSSTCCGIMYIT